MKIVFQGDSITDCGRDRTNNEKLSGYTQMVKDGLGIPSNHYYNFGISGDRSIEVLDRVLGELAYVVPDVFVMLIGINDVWRYYDSNLYTSPEQYRTNVQLILRNVLAFNRSAKMILLEPFLLPAEDKAEWGELLDKFRAVSKELAEEFGAAFIPLHSIFEEEASKRPWQDFSQDGVHPTELGNEVIAKHLISEILKLS